MTHVLGHRAGVAWSLAVLGVGATSAFAQLAVTSTSPAINASNIARNAPISVTFDRAVNPATFTAANFKAFARWSGPVTGSLVFSNADRTVTLTPAHAFAAGEQVTLYMSHNLRAADNSFLRTAGYAVSFTTAVRPSQHIFRESQRLYTRGPNGVGPESHIYGGLACDLNQDGWSDMTIVNEVSADLRVFMNRADGTGMNPTFLTPPTPIPFESSPNEPADFNGDGLVDIVVSSNGTHQIAIALGNGNGTFQTPTLKNVGNYPRGFGIMDVDGDGDLDITVAQAQSNNIALLLNNGSGVFSNPTTFEGGVEDEYGMTAADMNEDGIMDLVVGGVGSNTVSVMLGNGNGTFTPGGSRSCGGAPWVIVCADLNGDRHMDVSTANSFSANGSVLLGNGNGTLQAATVLPSGGHTVATDLPDIDGDGDADWVLSSYGGSQWIVFLNDGAGHFAPLETFPAPHNPACCLPFDFDNDGDVDLALLDETTDIIVMMSNVCPADINAQGGVTVQDIFDFLAAYFGSQPLADFNGAGGITVQDIFDFLTAYFSVC
jgi:hypothetical protein